MMDIPYRIAVRPNLNKKGFLTIHSVGPKGGVDYSRALMHTDDCVFLRHVKAHVQPGLERRAKTGAKIPCASLTGTFAGFGDMEWSGEPVVRYNPKNDYGFLFDFHPQGATVCCTFSKFFRVSPTDYDRNRVIMV